MNPHGAPCIKHAVFFLTHKRWKGTIALFLFLGFVFLLMMSLVHINGIRLKNERRYLQTRKWASVYIRIIPLCPGFKCTAAINFKRATSESECSKLILTPWTLFPPLTFSSRGQHSVQGCFNLKRVYFVVVLGPDLPIQDPLCTWAIILQIPAR